MIVVFFAAGCLEIVSILFRPVSLSFRLYGNVFAGENMLETMATIVPGLGWLLPIPFYFMELLVGLVQALVFMLLTAVFTLLICQHHEEAGPAASRTADACAAGGRPRPSQATNEKGQHDDDRKLARRPGGAGRSHRRRVDRHGGVDAVGRNPGASTKIMVQSILAIAFAEAIVFYALFLVQLERGRCADDHAACSRCRPPPKAADRSSEIARTFGVDWPHLLRADHQLRHRLRRALPARLHADPADARGAAAADRRAAWPTPRRSRPSWPGSKRSARTSWPRRTPRASS